MAKLKKCLSELNGLLSQEEEKFLIKTEEDSQIGNDVQAANFAITQYYKQLHDKLNDLKTKVGLPAMPYPDFVLANEAVPKTEYKPKLPSEKQVASAKKAMRYKEAEKAFSLIGRYKSLSRAAKRGSVGSAIMSAIRDEVARINADILLTSRGVKIINKDGSVVSKPPAKSSADFVSMQKERKQILKDALNAEPDTLEYAVIQDIANGAVFSLESFKKYTKLKGKEIDAAPSYLINDNPNSKKLDLYTRNEGVFAIDEKSSAELIAETLQNYFTKNARERAAIDLVAMYEDRFLEKGEQGLDKEQLKELELLELENEELIKAVEDIEAEIAEMAKKDLDAQELMEAEQRDILEQDKMNDELIKLLNIGYARESAQAQVNKEIDARVERGELAPEEAEQSYFFQKKNETKRAENIDKNALKDVESTEAALKNKNLEGILPSFSINGLNKFFHASNRERVGRLKKSNAPQFGSGIYFSTNKDLVVDEFGEKVTEVALDLKNPVFTNSNDWNKVTDLAIKKENEGKDLDEDGNIIGETYDYYEINPINISDAATELGYDSIIDEGSSQYDNEIIVLDESRIVYEEDLARAVSEAYHKAKLDRSNPDLLKNVESLVIFNPKELLNKSDFFQKKNETKGAEIIDKVVAVIKKALPKVAIEFDDNLVDDDGLPAAGRVKGNVITINRNYASNDTPIHEAGHILIDAIGYNNKVIQAAIAELKKTPLWKETKETYRELSEEMLGKEVLAEAIGREGAGIFETESQKSKFKAMLSYIFDRIKRLLGIEKNVAKSLAKQIIAGIGTKDLVGTTAQAQMAKRKVLSDAQAQVKELVDAIAENEDLSSIPYEELLDVYNAINAQDIPGKSKYLKDVKIRIGMNIFEREKTKLQKNKDFSADRAATKDVTAKDVKFKVLSHFTDAYPEFKSLSEMWDAAYFAKIKESREGKNTNEKLAIEVIKDRNSRLGITQRAIEMVQSLFTSVNYKYFSFLDNGKGKLVTLSEAKKKGYSKAQIEYLKFVRDLIASRKILMDSDDIYNMDMEVLKLDKGFSEAFKTDGLAQAFGNWLSSSDGLRETQIEFKNPITGKTSITSYQNAETALVKYGEKGPKEKAQSIALILKYNFAARRKKSDAENKQRGTYYLDENGQLKSKFDRKRPPEASYSTDFYKAVSEYIDDNAHITHISPLMPVIESIEYLNKRGVYEFDDDGNKTPIHAKKPNVVKWINEWRDLHVLRQKDEGIPELDASLKFLRFLTSATTMMFNIPAGLMNIAIGNYNAWRTGNTEMVAKGNARLFGGKKKFKSDYGYGLINPIAVDIARKYNAVSTDIDSNPIQTLSGIMSKLGHAITKYGEFQIQASGLLGLMSDEDFNSFEYRKNKFGVDELVFKKNVPPQKQLEIESRILKHINTVSDIQGKYSEKDRRNIQNNELGKALMQFKVYLPDYWRMRFGKDVGSWYIMLNGGLKELKKDIKDNGLKKGLWDNESREAKAFMSNLKGTAAVALFMILSHSDDDDDEGAVAFAEKMLSNLLGIFDPVQLKFTLTRPIAAMGVVDRFLTAVEHLSLWSEDAYMKSDSKYGEKGDAKILNDVKGLIPGRKVADALDMFSEDEE